MALGEGANLVPQSAERVSTVRGEVLGDSHFAEEAGIMLKDFSRFMAAVKFTENACDPFHNGGIGIAIKVTMIFPELRRKPEMGKTAFDQIRVGFEGGIHGGQLFGPFHDFGQATPAIR